MLWHLCMQYLKISFKNYLILDTHYIETYLLRLLKTNIASHWICAQWPNNPFAAFSLGSHLSSSKLSILWCRAHVRILWSYIAVVTNILHDYFRWCRGNDKIAPVLQCLRNKFKQQGQINCLRELWGERKESKTLANTQCNKQWFCTSKRRFAVIIMRILLLFISRKQQNIDTASQASYTLLFVGRIHIIPLVLLQRRRFQFCLMSRMTNICKKNIIIVESVTVTNISTLCL